MTSRPCDLRYDTVSAINFRFSSSVIPSARCTWKSHDFQKMEIVWVSGGEQRGYVRILLYRIFGKSRGAECRQFRVF